jgi:anaphase-promoting complex subunit 4
VFTLRSGIDFLFPPFNAEESDHLHVMVVGTGDGALHLSMYDSFVIGSFQNALSQDPSSGAAGFRLVHHTSHPDISTHSLFFQSSEDDHQTSVELVPMDLSFIPSSPVNLSLLASKLTTLQKLLRYARQTQLHMQVEWTNTRELPGRFLGGIQEDLEKAEYGPRNIIQALYHTVLTGHANQLMREWLVDNLAERVSPARSLQPPHADAPTIRATSAGTKQSSPVWKVYAISSTKTFSRPWSALSSSSPGSAV